MSEASSPQQLRADIEAHLASEEWPMAAAGLIELGELVDSAEERYELYAQAADTYESGAEDIASAVIARVLAAEVLADELGRLEDAIVVYQIVLAADETNTNALEGLEALYGETEDWNELLALFERRAELAPGDEERVELCRKQAIILQEVLQDTRGAADAWSMLLDLRPDDQEAAAALEKLYTDGGRWANLVAYYVAQSERVSAAESIEYLIRAAQVQQVQLESNSDALATWALVVKKDPGNTTALTALERLHADADDTPRLIEVLEQRATAESDEDAKLQLFVRLGDLYWHHQQDEQAAIGALERALGVRKHYVPAIDALIAMFIDTHKWEMASNTLTLKLQAVPTNAEKSQVHLELARMMTQQMGSADFGVGHLEAAVEFHPENREALLALGDYYFDGEQWTKALPVLEAAAPHMHKVRDREALAVLHAQVGRCSEELLDPERAVTAYENSVRLVKPSADLLWRLALLQHEDEQYMEAQKYLQRLEAYYGDELSPGRKGKLPILLSECAAEMGKMTLAVNIASAADMLAPQDADGLRRLIPILEGRGKVSQVLEYKERLYALADSEQERATVAADIADSYKKQDDLMAAMDWYRNALLLQPGNKGAILALLEILLKRGEFEEAIGQLETLAGLETTPGKQARWLMSIAAIYSDELRQPDAARDYYERVLDVDPNNLEAFQGLDGMLTAARKWKELERSYRRMIQRVTKRIEDNAADKRARKLLFMLYRNLGEIYRSRMERAEYAISAYEMALKYSPADAKTRHMLAKLCVRTPNQTDKAIENYRFLVRAYPEQFDHYHKLSALYTTTGQIDRAWSVSGLLRILGKAHEAEDRMYDKLAPRQLARPRKPFDQGTWFRHVMTQKEDPAMGQLFQFLQAILGPGTIFKSLKALGFGKGDKVNVGGLKTAFTVSLTQSCKVLGIPLPEVYSLPSTNGIKVLKTSSLALAVSPKLLASKSLQGLGFHVAKRVVYCHPWHTMAALYDAKTLYAFFASAATLLNPQFPVQMSADIMPADRARHIQLITELRTQLSEALTPESAQQLTTVLQAIRNVENPGVVSEWHRAVELTANRAALFVANDVHLVGRIIKGETVGMSTLGPKEKLRDLVTYVLGDRYAGLRKTMGVALADR